MANLSFVIRCVDGLLIATDTSVPLGLTAPYDVRQDILQVSHRRAVIFHGSNRTIAQRWFQDAALRDIVGEDAETATIMQQLTGALATRFRALGTSGPAPRVWFGVLLAGYFEDAGDFLTMNFNAPDFALNPVPHNVFAGVEDVARFLDTKFPPRSFAVEQALTYAAFLILQSSSALPAILRPSMVAATITQDNGFHWEPDERITEALRAAIQIGRTLDRKAALLFTGDANGGKVL